MFDFSQINISKSAYNESERFLTIPTSLSYSSNYL